MSATTVPHGTPSGYNWHRCRCDDCRRWCRDQAREARAKKRDAEGAPSAAQLQKKLTGALSHVAYWKREAEEARALALLYQLQAKAAEKKAGARA